MIPEGWSSTELLDLSSNGLMNGAFNDPKLVGIGYKLINVVNLYSDPYIKTTELELLNLPSSDYEKFKAEKGDIFFTRSSLKLEGIAHCNIFLDNRDDVIFECHIIRVRPNKKKVDPRYLHYYCVSPNARKHFMSYAKTTTMTTIDQNGIGSLKVLLPPLPEQCKIAEILSTWDKAIALLEQLITAKRKLKQGLMQQLLTGKKRFKEFEGLTWEVKKIKDIGKVISGGTPDTNNPDYWNGDIPWCTPSEITALKDKYMSFTNRTISNEGVKSSSTAILPINSLLVCTRATIGYCAINTVPMCTNQGFKNLIPNKQYFVSYLYYKFLLEKHQLLRLASGSTFLEISKKDFESIEIDIPSLAEQQKIAFILSAADTEISNLEKQLAAYKQQKRGLMQQLLTGKKRVKIDESQMQKV